MPGSPGRSCWNAVRSHSSREMTLVALTEQLPDPNNRITPDFDRLDAIGAQAPRFLPTGRLHRLRAGRGPQHARAAFSRGRRDRDRHLPYAEGAGHIMGTTRMGNGRQDIGGDRGGPKPRPSQSVVRRHRCFRHRVRRTRP